MSRQPRWIENLKVRTGLAVFGIVVLAVVMYLAPRIPQPGPASYGTPAEQSAEQSATPARATASMPASADSAQPFDASQLDPRVTQATVASTIGSHGWSSRVRPPTSVTEPIKKALMRQHHYTDSMRDYELDHFIPLGVGGSSTMSNLWLEPIAEARLKDRDEYLAYKNVTAGRWTLAYGQQYIRNRWRIHYAQ